MFILRPVILAALGVALIDSAAAATLTPERVFSNPDLNGAVARNVQLSPDGTLATFLKGGEDDQNRLDLWAVDLKGGAPFRLIDARTLTPAHVELTEEEKNRRQRMRISQHGIVEYHWSETGKFLLVPIDGQLYVVPRGGQPQRLKSAGEGTLDAKISPQDHFVSYERGGNMFVTDLATGRERALTTSGKGPVSWGTSEFIAQEELERYTGNWWSPDERRIALTRVDVSKVDIIPRLEIGASGLTTVDQRYPRPGRPNARVDLFVEDIASGKRVQMDLGTNPDIYLARVAWSDDGKTLYVQRLNRSQQDLDLLACAPQSGACTRLLKQTSPHWIDLSDDFRPLKNGDFLWSSEASGYRHLYLYGPDGHQIRQITSGDWPVAGIDGVDEKAGTVFFTASKDTPIESQIYAISYTRADTPHRLTEGNGWWSAHMGKDASAFIGQYSDPMTPQRTGLFGADGHLIRWIEENRLDSSHPYYPYLSARVVPEFGTLTAKDGSALHYSLTKPTHFDPAKKYPVIIEVYGGPHAQMVRRDWGSISDQLFAEAGYIIFRLDNHGSANRSVAFKTAIDRRLGTLETEDQLQGAAFLRGLPFVDGAHIGVSGWSYGGFMTLEMLTAKGATFAAGASGAPPTDWALYDTAYTERYMGTPAENPDGYRQSDILNRLDGLNGRLLLLKGLSDDNVILANSTRLMAALQARSVPFDLMDYPGERHGIAGNAKNLQRMRIYLEFFARTLGGSALGE